MLSASRGRFWPILVYLVLAAGTLGLAATIAAANMPFDQPNRDIWQHLAALRALMADLSDPANPFVGTMETSRHFNLQWVSMAWLGKTLGLDLWQTMTLAGYLSMLLLAGGVWAFARAFFPQAWAPVLLLVVVLFGWGRQIQHTGFHSFETLLYAAAYPATVLVALSLFLWAAVIRALSALWMLPVVAGLMLAMLATHQLGAVIGGVVAAAFALAQPGAGLARRRAVLAALFAGAALSPLWPYYNPVLIIFAPGNSDWLGGPNFYGHPVQTWALIPAALGVLGMGGAQGRPLRLGLFFLLCVYLIGLTGPQIAGRFLMGIVLVLQVGLVAFLLQLFARLPVTDWLRLQVGALTLLWVGVMTVLLTHKFQTRFAEIAAIAPGQYAAALSLTEDIPDAEEVAAHEVTAWTVAATGQPVLSVPWPEPGITDLAARRVLLAQLFAPDLTAEARRSLAEAASVRTLIADVRFVPPAVLAALEA